MKSGTMAGLSLSITILLACITQAADTSTVYDIPEIENITIDGHPDDWVKQGFCVEFLSDPEGRTRSYDDFDVRFRIGWNREGLFVLAFVRDDAAEEHEEPTRLWQKDCVEIFLADRVGSRNRIQLVIASGADPKYGRERHMLYDHRPEKQSPPVLTSRSASRIRAGGHVIEAMLPWENLGLVPEVGMEAAFQFVANDQDGDASPLRVAWYPGLNSHRDPAEMHRVKLAREPSEAVRIRIDRKIGVGRCTVMIQGAKELIGVPFMIRNGSGVIVEDQLAQRDGRAGAQIDIPPLSGTDAWPRLDVILENGPTTVFDALPSLDGILKRCVRASGGHAVMENLKTRFMKGKLIHDLSYRDPPVVEIPFDAYWKTPDQYLMILYPSEGIYQEGFDGKTAWKREADGIQRVDRASLSSISWFLDPHFVLRVQDVFLELVMKKSKSDGAFVEATMPGGVRRELRFDPDAGLAARIGHLELGDYRKTDGVMLPFRMSMNRKGGSSTYVIDEVKHNVPMDADRFAVPDSVEVFANLFQGIDDPKALPMLKHLPFKHGGMNVPSQDGRLLYDLVVKNGYRRGLELGTSNGYSTLWLGLAFRKTGGKVTTIEYEPLRAKEARENFRKAGLDSVIDPILGDAFEEIPKLEGDFDFIFIDAWKKDYIKFLEMLRRRVPPGGAITAHNVISFQRDMQDFLDAIQNDPALETTIHRTSTAGVSVSIVRK